MGMIYHPHSTAKISDLDLALKIPGLLDPAVMARLADAVEESSLLWRVDLVDYQALSPAFHAAVQADFVPLE